MTIRDLNTLSRIIISRRADEDDYIEDEEESDIEETLDDIDEDGEELEPKRKKHISEEDETEDSGNDE